jgi:hypothetical protein
MGASCLRAQEPQLMRSPGEPLQLNQHPFGSMIELAVIGHRPRQRCLAWFGRNHDLAKDFERQLSPVLPFSAPLRHCHCAGHSAGGSSNCQAFLCLTDAPLPFALRNGAANQLHFSPGDFGQSVLNGRAAVKPVIFAMAVGFRGN